MQCNQSSFGFFQKGFTLIETIVGIVVLAISFSILTSLIYPIAEQSADQLHQVKAAELAQSMLNEIQNKAFDENSDMAGGLLRCGETGASNCSTNMGPEDGEDGRLDKGESSPDLFNDVDDYNNLVYNTGEIKNYTGYTMSIRVCNDADYNGVCNADPAINKSTAKLITVSIVTPTDFSLHFSTYRANF